MIQREQRVHELVRWAELKGLKVTEEDHDVLDGIIRMAVNDGFKSAMTNIEDFMKLSSKYGVAETYQAIEKGVRNIED